MRQYKIFLVLPLFLLAYSANAQSIKGTLADPIENTKIANATVQLKLISDTTKTFSSITDSKGNFSFTNLIVGSYLFRASSVGFEVLTQVFSLSDSLRHLDVGLLYLPKKTITLEGVVIVAQPPAAKQIADTTQFSASQFKVNPDANVEDLIKKMPGITVDRSGTVTAQGEQVRKVTVDGRDFFGDDATAALRNLPSEVVEKIQVYDRLSEQAQLTGFDDGNAVKAINIVTKSGIRNSQFGRIYAGYGTDDRYQAGGNVTFLKDYRRISLIGNFNNVNQQNFANQDLLGVTSSATGRGRGGGGGSGGMGAGDFMVGPSPGISKTNAFGINYNDRWGKKIQVSGSYFFNNSNNSNETKTTTETPYAQPLRQYTESKSNANNNNHRINLRFEYKIDSVNTLFYIPSVNFQNNNSNGSSMGYAFRLPDDSVSSYTSNNFTHRFGYSIGNTLMFRHTFKKRGRTFSISATSNHDKNDGYTDYYNAQRTYTPTIKDSLQNRQTTNNTNGARYSGRIAFTEPIGKQGLLEFNYSPGTQINHADQMAYGFDGTDYTLFIPNNSNLFDNTIVTNNGGVNYRYGQSRDNQLSFGVNFQNSNLESKRIFPNQSKVDQSFNILLPNLRWMRKIGKYSNIRVFYRANTLFPSINQLQDVPNTSNALRPSVGDPNLKPAYSHTGTGRYTYTNTRNNTSFFANVFVQTTDNYITNASYLIRKDSTIEQNEKVAAGAQLSKPINLNGYKRINSFFTYSMPVKLIKSTVNLNAGYGYSEIPGMLDYIRILTKTINYNGGIVLASNISELIDFNISYNVNYNNAKSNNNRQGNFVTTKYTNQAVSGQANLLTNNGWFLTNDISYQKYSGLSDGFNQEYTLWNAGIGKKFLKNRVGELKLTVFDLLKQNQSITRTVSSGGIITDAQNQVLTQYFMLTFTYSLKNFGKGKAPSREDRGQWRGEGPPSGMRPGGGFPGGGGPMF